MHQGFMGLDSNFSKVVLLFLLVTAINLLTNAVGSNHRIVEIISLYWIQMHYDK